MNHKLEDIIYLTKSYISEVIEDIKEWLDRTFNHL
jgi:hypothetical protein